MTEDETVAWHHQLNGHKFEQTLGDVEGQSLYFSLYFSTVLQTKESDTTERLNNNPYDEKNFFFFFRVNSRRPCSSLALVVGAQS